MILVSDIRLPLGSSEEEAIEKARIRLGHPQAEGHYRLRRLSYDFRKGRALQVCSVLADFRDQQLEEQLIRGLDNCRQIEKKTLAPVIGNEPLAFRPVVVGSGPAGLFCAYLLSLHGYRPLLIERGAPMDERTKMVESFFLGGELDYETNVQFGEGGAGTFSDGKLTSRIHDELCEYVLHTFYRFGAPEDILYRAKPHIGTDQLKDIIKRMRAAIEENGGEVRFHCRLDDILVKDGAVYGVMTSQGAIPCQALILACGHSARDTFAMLADKSLSITTKPFSVGMRIEHLQSQVDASLYGKFAGNALLPPGEYQLSEQVNGRGVYTFCMCPGGQVVAAASEYGGSVTNGMSEYARDGKNANSAICVSVSGKDFGMNPFRAMEFQRQLEQAAYAAAGGHYPAPGCDVESFLEGRGNLRIGTVQPTYSRGVVGVDMEKIFGRELTAALRGGLRAFGRRMDCFRQEDGILTGVETRTSSPLRIERHEDRQAVGLMGLYPCGEGAGYAGGITSAAVDGLRTACALMERYCPANE